MSNDPYKDFDEFYREYTKEEEASTKAPSSDAPSDPDPVQDQPSWGPQPVTGPQNPFPSTPGHHTPPPAPRYGSPYGAPSPFMGGHSPVPYGRTAPPDRQRNSSMLRINAWLSVFFPVASIIFFFTEKGKNPLYDKHLRETLNMGITRMLIGAGAAWIGGFLGTMLGLATVVYFVLAVLGAIESPTKYLQGQETRYKGAIPFTRED